MKIIYALPIEEEGLSLEERQRLLALVGHLETQAHEWMRVHHPVVSFDTQHIAPSHDQDFDCQLADCHKHYRVIAATETEQKRGEQILAELHEYICQQW